jgi:elongator complex protein 2
VLSSHTAHVRAVKFLPRSQDGQDTYLVTGGDDRHIKLWRVHGDNVLASGPAHTAEEHGGGINCIAALRSPVGTSARRVFASGAADATIKIWSLENDQLSVLQTIKTSTKYLALAIFLHPLGYDGNSFLMAVAGTTNVVQIFVAVVDGVSMEFKLQATLSGHENWVRSLDIVSEKTSPDSDLLLASASQDKYIRLWRIHKGSALSALSGAVGQDMTMSGFMPGNKIHKLKAGSESYCIMFEALLLGHEDWIYSARWNRTQTNKLQLMSASADNSISIWEADTESGIWLTTARLGEVGREKGATTATGSTGGFWTCLWSPSGTTVVTLGRTGSWRRWDYDESEDRWVQKMAISGHTRAVTGLSWSRNGEYLLSTSADQTTRLHAQWKASGGRGSWHEMARPQIHGYDLNCIDTLGDASFVSGADEKLMRVFTEPKAVARMLNRLIGTDATGGRLESLPEAANMPVLGLSNKAIDVVDDTTAGKETTQGAGGTQPEQDGQGGAENADSVRLDSTLRKSALDMAHPPFEESLSRHTLWPEAEKLYGHGYELSCLAASHDGSLIASASRASSVNHAVIRLFETRRWTEVRPPLAAHSLTVARVRFSDDDRLLLSIGRDRQWAVFARESKAKVDGGDAGDEAPCGFALLQANPKAHTRMLLDAAWAPSAAERPAMFATAGRDKQVKLWMQKGESGQFELVKTIAHEHPVMALDFLPRTTQQGRLALAVGTEAGYISVLLLKMEPDAVDVVSTLHVKSEFCPQRPILQLAWRPVQTSAVKGKDENQGCDLAIASEDGTLRIYCFSF